MLSITRVIFLQTNQNVCFEKGRISLANRLEHDWNAAIINRSDVLHLRLSCYELKKSQKRFWNRLLMKQAINEENK